VLTFLLDRKRLVPVSALGSSAEVRPPSSLPLLQQKLADPVHELRRSEQLPLRMHYENVTDSGSRWNRFFCCVLKLRRISQSVRFSQVTSARSVISDSEFCLHFWVVLETSQLSDCCFQTWQP
jgi:hypothetical protein